MSKLPCPCCGGKVVTKAYLHSFPGLSGIGCVVYCPKGCFDPPMRVFWDWDHTRKGVRRMLNYAEYRWNNVAAPQLAKEYEQWLKNESEVSR